MRRESNCCVFCALATPCGVGFLLLCAVGASARTARASSTVDSPFAVIGPGPNEIGASVSFDNSFFARVEGKSTFHMLGFPLGVFERVDLDLERSSPFAADATIVVRKPLGDMRIPPPELLCLTGRISGEPDSRVFIGVARAGAATLVNGLLERAQGGESKTFILSGGPMNDGDGIVIYNTRTIPAGWLVTAPLRCASEATTLSAPTWNVRPSAGSPRGAPPCRLATIAIDTDQEYLLDRFGGNAAAAAAYVGTLVGAVSEIYRRDFNARLQIGYLRLWQTQDPWDETDAYAQLYQFQDYWNDNMDGIARNAVHFLTARTLDQANGLAYRDGLCAYQYDYSMSSQINGFFPYPIQDHSPQNWDLFMMAHELGHNFGAQHTHEMDPPVDLCNQGDCSVAPDGTIMSFCYQCPGGMADVVMHLHPRSVQEAILPFLASGAACDLTTHAQITQQPVSHNGCPGQLFTLSVAAGGFDPIHYQWRRNGIDLPGATSAVFTIASFWPPQAGVFDVVVTDSCGSVTSDPANIGVCAGVVGDLNMNCRVDIGDLTYFLTRFGRAGSLLADFDGDGDVDVSDLAVILGSFGSDGCN